MIGLRDDPGASGAINTSSLLVKLEEKRFITYDPDVDRMVLQPPATGASSGSSAVASASMLSDSSNGASSQSWGESKETEERDADSGDRVAGMLETFLAWREKEPPKSRVAPTADVVSNVEASASALAARV